jgi:hypothetical protein
MMSSVGLNAGLYARIRDYAVMLDDVLIRLKSGSVSSTDERLQHLAAVLHNLGAGGHRDVETLLLLAVVQTNDAPRGRTPAWEQMSRDLLAGSATTTLIAQLEWLATTLEQERFGMLAKLRGT